MLFSIVTPDCGLHQAQQYCSILLTTMNNVGSKTLNNAVLTALNRLCVFTRVAQIRQTAHVQVLANNMAAALRLFMGFFRKVIPLYAITLCLEAKSL